MNNSRLTRKKNLEILMMIVHQHTRTEIEACDPYDMMIEEKLGKATTLKDLSELDLTAETPHYDLYADDFEGT
jgi:hypothetical protein